LGLRHWRYQVGAFPPGWFEWNDRFRDTVRSFWRGDKGKLPELASRLTASGDLFNWGGRRPFASINFLTAHDGFTVRDLVSYNDKHNEANGDNNQDGNDNNISYNHGAEGETDDPEIRALRLRQIRNLLSTLLLAQGTPMLVAGDEFGNSQQGNNNVYCQDNELSWLNWDWDEEAQGLVDFTRKLIRLRHDYPILRRGRFLVGAYNEELGVKDVTWITPAGAEMDDHLWGTSETESLGMIMDGRAQPSGVHRMGADATLLLILNAHHDPVIFHLPEVAQGSCWLRLVDTNCPKQETEDVYKFRQEFVVTGRSLVLFKLCTEASKS
jgi:isoamylase